MDAEEEDEVVWADRCSGWYDDDDALFFLKNCSGADLIECDELRVDIGSREDVAVPPLNVGNLL